jgi:RNA polymerase sigma-70 factor (ECF subfamily)
VTETDHSPIDRFGVLYDQYYAAVLRYAARRIGAEAARDVAADTFLTAWRRLDRVPASEPLPWLYATARRCLANELRRRDSRQRLNSRMRAEATAGLEEAGPELSERVADRLTVLSALATLRPADQEALRLIEWEELDTAAAAQAAGCSAAAFKVRLHRARRRLARALGEQQPGIAPATPSPPLTTRTEVSA